MDVKMDVFKKKRWYRLGLLFLIGSLYGVFAHTLNFDALAAFSQIPQGFLWLGQNFAPDSTTMDHLFLTHVFLILLRTVVIAVSATMIASGFALLAAVVGSQKTGIHPVAIYLVRGIAMVFRNIPMIAWALILLFSFRQNEFTGFLALFFGTFGYLTRTLTEVIDESSDGVLEALRATGANYFSVIFQGVLPMISSQVISWVLFMIESNVRESALVGILTGTGIGFLFNFYFTSFRYPRAGMVLLFIIVTVLGLEMLSNKIRRLII